MSIKKNIVLIPYWVEDTLKRNRLPLRACLNFNELKSVMALGDLVSFTALQRYVTLCTGMKDASLGSLFMLWLESIPQDNREMVEFLTNQVGKLENDPSFATALEARLFISEAKSERYPTPFITYDLTREVAGVVIYPGFFGPHEPNLTGLQQELVVALLKLLYVYHAYSEVARTPLFRRYLELLSRKQIIV